MMEKTKYKQQGIIALTILAMAAWVTFTFIGLGTTAVNGSPADCPNGPLRADLNGTATTSGKAPSGMAMYKDKGSNALTVMVRGVNVTAETTLKVLIGGTSVGTINVKKNGNGQMKLDSASGISEGTEIMVMNGTTAVLSGTFACTGGGGNTNTTPSPTATMTMTPSPTATPTATPTVTPTTTPTATPTVMPTVTPTATTTPTVTPTPTPTVAPAA
jgi:hypothetical protein